MKRYHNHIFKNIFFILALILGCLTAHSAYAAEEVAPSIKHPITQKLLTLEEQELKTIITRLYEQAHHYTLAHELPYPFLTCHQRILDQSPLTKDDLIVALYTALEWLTKELKTIQETYITDATKPRAPRPDASDFPVPPPSLTDEIAELMALVGIVRTRIGTVDDSSCDKTVLGILGDACTILGPDETISSGIKDIQTTLTSLDEIVVELNNTVTTLNAISIDLDNTLTTLNALTIDLDNTLTTIQYVSTQLESTLTILEDIDREVEWTLTTLGYPAQDLGKDATISGTLFNIMQCCDALTATVIRDFNETWSILGSLQTDLDGSFTMLEKIDDEVNGTLTVLGNPGDILGADATVSGTLLNIAQCCDALTATVIRDFNETWSILGSLQTDLDGSFTMLEKIDDEVNGTLTVLGNPGDILGADATVSGTLLNIAQCCDALTATVIRDFNETWTILKAIQSFSELDEHCPTILNSDDILPNGYTITSPGYYTLCGSIGFDAPGTSTCVIRVQASNVTLDLNQHTIYQSDADANLDGICIDNGFSNVVIKNGKVAGVTNSGITVGNGSSDIILSNLMIRNCGSAGIVFTGITGVRNRDVLIEQVQSTNNSGNGATFIFTEKVKIVDSKFNDNVVVGASFSSSSGNEITNSTFNQNGGAGAAIGLDLQATASSVIRDCVFNANSSSTSTARGLVVTSSCNYIENCIADGNTTSAASTAVGFDIDGTAHMLSNCSATGNAAPSGTGIGVRVNSSAFRCLVRNSTALTNSSRGFQHDATTGYNFFLGNLSLGHGSNSNNYFGSGLGYISVGAGSQLVDTFDNQRINNISII